MTRHVASTLLTALLALTVAGCEGTVTGPNSLPDARASLKMEGQSIELEASPYRDFMPGDLDTRLIVAVELTAENPDAVRAEFVEFGTLWVKHGSEVWSREVENVPERIHGDEVLVGRADGGPKWPVGDTVTVVVEVEADPMGTVHLKAENVEIRRVS